MALVRLLPLTAPRSAFKLDIFSPRPPGSLYRPIGAAFLAEPSRAFTVEALVLVSFRTVNRTEKKHRVATL